MPAGFTRSAAPSQHWPCGQECGHAQALANTYGEWLWCHHPDRGGRVVREGHECTHFQAPTSNEPTPPLPFDPD